MARRPHRAIPALLEALDPRKLLSADPGWTYAYASSNYSIGPSPIAFYAHHAANPSLNNATVRFIVSKDATVGNADDIVLASSRYADSAGPVDARLPDLAPGKYHFFATCNNAHAISAGDLTVYANTAGPDLAITPDSDFFGLPPSFPAGEFHGVSAGVMNLGKTTAKDVYVAFYLSPTPTLSPDAVLVQKGTFIGPSHDVAGRDRNWITLTADMPQVPVGTYYPIYVVDPDNLVAEADETNNTFVGDAVQVVPPTANITLLSVSTAGTATMNPYGWTDPVPLDVTFRSTGSPHNFRLIIYLSTDDVAGNADDLCVGYTDYFDTPAPGSPDTVTVHTTVSYSFYGSTAPIAPGTYRLVVKTDTPPDITPDDNTILGPDLTVYGPTFPPPPPPPPPPPTPDLTLDPVTVRTPDHVYPGSRIFASAGARTDTGSFSSYVAVRYALSVDDVAGNEDDILIDTKQQLAFVNPLSSDALPVASYANMTLPSSVAPGTYHIVAIVDPDNAVAETDETNNSVVGPTVTVEAAPPLDLTPGPVTAAYGPIYPGYGIGLDGLPVANVPFSQTVKTAYYLSADDVIGNEDDVLLGTTPDIPTENGWPGSEVRLVFYLPYPPIFFSRGLTVPASVAPGTYHVVSVVDPDDEVAEADETNNAAIGPDVTVSAIPPLDLTVSEPLVIRPSDVPLHPGSSLGVWASPSTTAPMPDPAVKVSIFLSADDVIGNDDDILLGSYTRGATFRGGVTPGVFVSDMVVALPDLTIPASVAPGTYHLIATVDPDDQVAEADETNNSVLGGTTITIDPAPAPCGGGLESTDDPAPVAGVESEDAPAPDLAAWLTAPAARVGAGSKGRASLTLKNKSGAAIARRYDVTFFLSSDPNPSSDDLPFSRQTITAKLGAGKARTLKLGFTLPAAAQAGEQYLIAVAVPAVRAKGAKAAALTAGGAGRVQAAARISVGAPHLAAEVRNVRTRGDAAALVRVRVTNTGTATFAGAATLRLLTDGESPETVLTARRVLNLKAGRHVDVTLTVAEAAAAGFRVAVS